MELTLDQMLQQGIAAHNVGNLQEAERLYRVVLQAHPKHPDANHNLGLIAVAMNQSDAALSLFKTAVEANPGIEQFWLNYIEALIAEQQFEDATRALKKAKKKGVAKAKLKTLTQKLGSVKAGNVPVQAPSQAEMQELINRYENGLYGDAENLALSITQQFPVHPFSWKILGGIYKALGRMADALIAGRKAAELDPRDNQAHNSLGVILEDLGRFEEAEASYKEAVLLKPDDCGAHYNLGNALRELDRYAEAEANYRQAIALRFDHAQAHSDLGFLLKALGRLEEAAEQFALNDSGMCKANRLRCFYMVDQQSNFYDELDHMVNQGENKALLGSLISQSNIRNEVNKHNPSCCEPLKYVLKVDLFEQYDFKTIFINGATEILGDQKVQYRRQNLLTKVVQTAGNIFTQGGPAFEVIQKFIQSELEKYRIIFQNRRNRT